MLVRRIVAGLIATCIGAFNIAPTVALSISQRTILLSGQSLAPLAGPFIFNDSFANYANGATIQGTKPALGMPWITTGSNVPTTSGGYAQSAGTGYLYAYMPAIPKTIVADVAFVGGSIGTKSFAMAYADNPMALQNLLHLNFGPSGYILSRVNAGTFTTIQSGNWAGTMKSGVLYRVQMSLGASLVTIIGPFGEVITASNASVAANVGQSAFWEPNLSSGQQAKLRNAYVIGPGTYFGPGDLASGWSAYYSLRSYSNATLGNKLVNVCNAGDASCVDLLSSATTGDLVLSGITCDNASNPCTIKTWYELTGTFTNGNLTQATGTKRATLVVPGSGNGCSDSTRFCAKFTGSSSQCYATSGTLSLTRPNGMTTVANYIAAANQALLADSSGNYEFIFGSNNSGRLYWDAISTQISSVMNTWYSMQGVITTTSASSTFYLNSTTSNLNGGNANFSNPVNIGADTSCAAGFLTGNIAEPGGFYGADFSSFPNEQTNLQRGYWRF